MTRPEAVPEAVRTVLDQLPPCVRSLPLPSVGADSGLVVTGDPVPGPELEQSDGLYWGLWVFRGALRSERPACRKEQGAARSLSVRALLVRRGARHASACLSRAQAAWWWADSFTT